MIKVSLMWLSWICCKKRLANSNPNWRSFSLSCTCAVLMCCDTLSKLQLSSSNLGSTTPRQAGPLLVIRMMAWSFTLSTLRLMSSSSSKTRWGQTDRQTDNRKARLCVIRYFRCSTAIFLQDGAVRAKNQSQFPRRDLQKGLIRWTVCLSVCH